MKSFKTRWQARFIEWVNQQDLLYARFNVLAEMIEKIFIEDIIENNERGISIAKSFHNTRKKCDELEFNEYGTPEAYTIQHFLVRYHRFILIYLNLINYNLLPIKRYKLNILDVGTGPAPALFALSDIYDLLKKFGTENKINALEKLEFQNDYVEKGEGFRNWLHHFTEYVNYKQDNYSWKVPYHHGTFKNFRGIMFDEEYYYEDYDIDDEIQRYKSKVKYRYNMVILSNFLTSENQVNLFTSELQNSALNLRNAGIILIVGASSTSEKYKKIYDAFLKVILSGKYSNYKFNGYCYEYKFKDNAFEYSYNDKWGERMRLCLKNILDHMAINDLLKFIHEKTLKELNLMINPASTGSSRWEVRLIRKNVSVKAKFKKRKPIYSNRL